MKSIDDTKQGNWETNYGHFGQIHELGLRQTSQTQLWGPSSGSECDNENLVHKLGERGYDGLHGRLLLPPNLARP